MAETFEPGPGADGFRVSTPPMLSLAPIAASLAMVFGYAAAAATGAPQCPHPAVTRQIRESQRLRVVVRRGGWA